MLTYDAHLPGSGEHAPVLVLLHGRGSDRHDLMRLRPHLPAGVGLVCPDAPFPGRDWGYGAGWAWYRYIAEDRPEPGSFDASIAAVGELLDELEARLPADAGPVVLGGFSQGGTTSLGYALQDPHRVRHVAVFSGFLADVPSVEVNRETAGGLSVFWGHGTHDPAIPFDLALRGRTRLEEAGARLDARDYPIGHGISPEELRDFGRWLDGIPSEGSSE